MDIREQQTATTRLNKYAATRLKKFILGLSKPPRNMNDALNLALSSLPATTLLDEYYELNENWSASLRAIEKQLREGFWLRRVQWYFLLTCVDYAITQAPESDISADSMDALVEITQALVAVLRSSKETTVDESYLLGNLGGAFAMDAQTLDTRLETLRENVSTHRSCSTATLVNRNNAILLRDEQHVATDVQITQALKHLTARVFRMAVRGHFLRTEKPLHEPQGFERFADCYQGVFGEGQCLKVFQSPDHNMGCILTLHQGERRARLSANTIVELNAYLSAFTSSSEDGLCYEGKFISYYKRGSGSLVRGGDDYMLSGGCTSIGISEKEHALIRNAFLAYLADPEAEQARQMCYNNFGFM